MNFTWGPIWPFCNVGSTPNHSDRKNRDPKKVFSNRSALTEGSIESSKGILYKNITNGQNQEGRKKKVPDPIMSFFGWGGRFAGTFLKKVELFWKKWNFFETGTFLKTCLKIELFRSKNIRWIWNVLEACLSQRIWYVVRRCLGGGVDDVN